MFISLYLLATTTTTTTPSCSDLTTVNMDPANDWDSTYVSPSQCPPPSGTDSCKCVQDSTSFILTNPGCTEFPIGGSGQVDEGFTMLTTLDGIQVGIRAQERFKGVVGVNPTPGTGSSAGVGLYTVEPGLSVPATSPSGAVGSWWGIDWQVDLRLGSKTIANYLVAGGLRLTAECTSGECGSFGTATGTSAIGGVYTVDLAPENLPTTTIPFFGNTWDLLQSSQNPYFSFWPWSPPSAGNLGLGDGSYDQNAEATYKFCLLLGDECPVCMEVEVRYPTDPIEIAGSPTQVDLTTAGTQGVCASCCAGNFDACLATGNESGNPYAVGPTPTQFWWFNRDVTYGTFVFQGDELCGIIDNTNTDSRTKMELWDGVYKDTPLSNFVQVSSEVFSMFTELVIRSYTHYCIVP